jgi:hypothetical protein
VAAGGVALAATPKRRRELGMDFRNETWWASEKGDI